MSLELVLVVGLLAVAARLLGSERAGGGFTALGALAFAAGFVLLMGKRDGLREAQAARESLESQAPHLERDGGYVSSDRCQACHPGPYHSWHRSYHRSMTQLATPMAVMAPFDGITLEAHGRSYTLSREGDAFFVDMVDLHWERDAVKRGSDISKVAEPPRRKARVVLTTGSHYMQTFWVDAPGTREVFNLPFVYDFESERWLPREDVFLRDPEAGPFKQIWNDNCIQCHSTGPQPRLNKTGADTRVGELGIACEACHGPAEEHVEANQSLARRYLLHLSGEADDTIVNPARLDHRASAQVCGQCHSKSLIANPKQWYAGDGLSYRPGDDLGKSRATMLPRSDPDHPGLRWAMKNDAGFVEQFFWKDGMIRVSGREYNGMVESECHKNGDLSCLSCHEMHGDDPNMQLRPNMRGEAACVQCHEEQSGAELEAHTHHAAGSTGSNCLNCHMPYTSYGLLRGLRSHLIDSPTVAATIETGRPNPCNQCHLDKTLGWAAETMAKWYGDPVKPLVLTEEDRTVAASVQWLLRGDAAQRALAAWAYGWEPARQASGTAWMGPLLTTLLGDPYSAVRYIAARSLRATPGYEAIEFDYVAPETERTTARQAIAGLFAGAEGAPPEVLIDETGQVRQALLDRLLSARDDRVVDLRE